MLDDGKYSLKGGKHGKYCADEGNTIRCSINSVGGWEKFEVGKIDANGDNVYMHKSLVPS